MSVAKSIGRTAKGGGAEHSLNEYNKVVLRILVTRWHQQWGAGGRGLGSHAVPGDERLWGVRQGAPHWLPGGQPAGAETLAPGPGGMQPGLDAIPATRLQAGGTQVGLG